MISAETIAAVVSIESGFDPLAIRINSDRPYLGPPGSKAEAIEIATTLVADGENVDLGLSGVSNYEFSALGVSISDLFDPCVNLKAAGTLLDRYYQAAVKTGASSGEADTMMLRSYYGHGDARTGAMVGYDRRIAEERQKISGTIDSITLRDADGGGGLPQREIADGLVSPTGAANSSASSASAVGSDPPLAEPIAPPPSWDVFGQGRQSTTLVFSQENRSVKE